MPKFQSSVYALINVTKHSIKLRRNMLKTDRIVNTKILASRLSRLTFITEWYDDRYTVSILRSIYTSECNYILWAETFTTTTDIGRIVADKRWCIDRYSVRSPEYLMTGLGGGGSLVPRPNDVALSQMYVIPWRRNSCAQSNCTVFVTSKCYIPNINEYSILEL